MYAYSKVMERISNSRIKDSFQDEDQIIFIAYPGTLGKVLGKGAENVKKAQLKLKKRVKVVEFSPSTESFVKNLIYPLKVREITEESEEVIIKDPDKKTKSLLIGRNAKNLKLLNSVVKRYCNKEIKVV